MADPPPTEATPDEAPKEPEAPASTPSEAPKAKAPPKRGRPAVEAAPPKGDSSAGLSLLVRLAALVGFGMSAFLFVEYMLPPGTGACGPGGGCETVRECALAGVGWFKWPIVGVLGYGTILFLSLRRDRAAGRFVRPLALLGGVTAAALIVLQQAVCHAWCKFCIVTDTAGITMAVAALLATRSTGLLAPPSDMARRFFGLAGAAALALSSIPYVQFNQYRTEVQRRVDTPQRVEELPGPVQREQRPGVATIVEFADFECPYCRRQHLVLRELLESYGTRVRFVRKHVPLSFHHHAEGAARAACCAEAQGRGEQLADMLFRSEDLSPAGCERLASQLGIDMARYRTCLDSSETSNRLRTDREDATGSTVQGLPTMFVGRERFEGVVSADALRASIERALTGAPPPADAAARSGS